MQMSATGLPSFTSLNVKLLAPTHSCLAVTGTSSPWKLGTFGNGWSPVLIGQPFGHTPNVPRRKKRTDPRNYLARQPVYPGDVSVTPPDAAAGAWGSALALHHRPAAVGEQARGGCHPHGIDQAC